MKKAVNDWHDLLSQPQFGVKTEKDVFVKMRDGVRLAIDIYRPDAPGKYPALLALGPYGKDLEEMVRWLPTSGRTDPLWDGCIEAGDVDYFVPRGYVHVIADERGAGASEGIFGFHEAEAPDLYDLIEWIAQQPWCNGNVGMIGVSWYGATQLLGAIVGPPHLKAVFPQEFGTDLYRQVYFHGGILCFFFLGLYWGVSGDSGCAMTATTRMAMYKALENPEIKRAIAERLKDPDIRQFPNLYHLLHYPEKCPPFVFAMLHPTNDDFWQSQAFNKRFDSIKCPVQLVSNWENEIYTPGALEAWEGIRNAPKKLMMTPPGFLRRPYVEYHEDMLRWYDYHLKGIDTGVMDEPPVKLFIMGINQWRNENEWPLARTQYTRYYLRSHGRLLAEPEARTSTPPDGLVQPPISSTAEVNTLRYITPPMSQDTEITGPIALYLHASIDQDDTNWMVAFNDIDPAGKATALSRGYLKASHRALDTVKSKPWRPYHPHINPEPVQAGDIFEYAIELLPNANVFKTGHRMELVIKTTESPKDPLYLELFPGGNHLPVGRTVSHKIYHDSEHPSYLLLPVIPPEKEKC